MEMIAIIASFSGVFLAGANVAIFCVIKFNDLKHMQDALDRIEKNQTTMWEKLDKTTERVAKVEGRLAER
jgi:hypothetical protein